jgi:hypothetical protein
MLCLRSRKNTFLIGTVDSRPCCLQPLVRPLLRPAEVAAPTHLSDSTEHRRGIVDRLLRKQCDSFRSRSKRTTSGRASPPNGWAYAKRPRLDRLPRLLGRAGKVRCRQPEHVNESMAAWESYANAGTEDRLVQAAIRHAFG